MLIFWENFKNGSNKSLFLNSAFQFSSIPGLQGTWKYPDPCFSIRKKKRLTETSPNCSLFQTTAASVRSFVYLPIASLASRASAQSVTDCITPTPTGPTTAARLSHPNPPWRPRGGAATSEDAKGDGYEGVGGKKRNNVCHWRIKSYTDI